MFDFVFAGSGVSALLLLKEILASTLKDSRILLLDVASKELENQSVSYWEKISSQKGFSTHSWDKVDVISKNFSRLESLDDYIFKYSKTSDFYRAQRDFAQDFPNVEFKKERVVDFIEGDNSVFVQTEKNRYQAKYAFTSLPRHKRSSGKGFEVKQYINGLFIRTSSPQFNCKTFRWLDLSVQQDNSFRFINLLPLSETEALIELVGLDANGGISLIKDYISTNLKIDDYEVVDHEAGVTILSNGHVKRQLSEHVLAIGATGGMVKASTGLGVHNMQKDAVSIVRSIESSGNPFNLRPPSRFYNFADYLLLKIYKYKPQSAYLIFSGMFKNNSVATIFKFLDEEASITQILKLFLAMKPWLLVKTFLFKKKLSS